MSEEATRLLLHKLREKHQEVNKQNRAFMKKIRKIFRDCRRNVDARDRLTKGDNGS
jgi:hypothetical protein